MSPSWSAGQSFVALAGAAVVILLAGRRLTVAADRLADRTGMGEALMGGLFLGAITSLPGITVSVLAAWDGHPRLALSNALGGIAAQTAFLAIADLAYRKANLEHAAASLPNMIWGGVLVALLAAMLVGMAGPDLHVAGIHPLTPLLFAGFLFGARLVRQARERPMWRPRMTAATAPDLPDEGERGAGTGWAAFTLTALLVAGAGAVAARSGISLVERSALSESLVGALLLAVVTSLPELVTSVAAVRRGALTLAVGGVLGGNAFDTLFAATADIAYRPGSIYHAAGGEEITLVAAGILMTAVLQLGLLHRQRRGIGNIGFESAALLGIYLATAIVLAVR